MRKNIFSKLKSVIASAAAVVMAASMVGAVPVAADTTYRITGPADGHTYKVYQIFTGDDDNGTLSNVKYGQNIASAKGTAGQDVKDSDLTTIQAVKDSTDKEKLAVIEQYADLTGNPVATIDDTNKTADVAGGYYIVVDSATKKLDDGRDGTFSTNLVFVAENVTLTPKRDVPTVEKKVKEKNDTANTTTGWQDAADYDIGDSIPYQLTATLPTNYETFKKYNLVFTDTLSTGLSLTSAQQSAITITDKDGNDVKSYFSIQYVDTNASAKTLTITASDLITSDATNKYLANGDNIIVSYEATLGTDAVIGSAGNPNTVKLTYSTNPNDAQGGTPGNTPEDKVTVFTFKLDVTKVDGNDNPLEGASFKLQKSINGTYTDVKTLSSTDATVTKDADNKVTSVVYSFSGLDAGDYKIVEVNAPANYTKADDINFTIAATYDTNSADPKLITLTSSNTSVTITTASDTGTTGKITSDGTFATKIVNRLESSLPATGGMGTTIFYIVGLALIAGAATLLAVKKRRNA